MSDIQNKDLHNTLHPTPLFLWIRVKKLQIIRLILNQIQ